MYNMYDMYAVKQLSNIIDTAHKSTLKNALVQYVDARNRYKQKFLILLAVQCKKYTARANTKQYLHQQKSLKWVSILNKR